MALNEVFMLFYVSANVSNFVHRLLCGMLTSSSSVQYSGQVDLVLEILIANLNMCK